jgi:hypothetical protein
MDEKRKPRSIGLWCAVAMLAALFLYLLSFGPVCWSLSASASKSTPGFTPIVRAPQVYWPIGWTANHSPRLIRGMIVWYATLFGSPLVAVPCDPSGEQQAALFDPSAFGNISP